MKNWEKLHPWTDDTKITYWISGVYKIVTYDGVIFRPYVIGHGQKNWGNYVGNPPTVYDLKGNQHKGYKSLKEAVDVCEKDFKTHNPLPKDIETAERVQNRIRTKGGW